MDGWGDRVTHTSPLERTDAAPAPPAPQLNLVADLSETSTGDELQALSSRGLLGAKRWQITAKRIIDIAGAALLTLILSPVMLLAGAAIFVSSRGPILYLQERVGRNGRKFRMAKFRSMVDGAHENRDELTDLNEISGPVFKMREDPAS